MSYMDRNSAKKHLKKWHRLEARSFNYTYNVLYINNQTWSDWVPNNVSSRTINKRNNRHGSPCLIFWLIPRI